jgi:hypothetical protein
MTKDAFWNGFFGELEKNAGSLDPETAKALMKHLKNLGKIGLFAAAALAGFRGLKHYTGLVDRLTAFPDVRVDERGRRTL